MRQPHFTLSKAPHTGKAWPAMPALPARTAQIHGAFVPQPRGSSFDTLVQVVCVTISAASRCG
ncbi:hypothetical protein ACU8KH_02463 [Lachancea thermotolerans]